ncbi:MAG: methyltransferase [Caulobacteraceae bacterium]
MTSAVYGAPALADVPADALKVSPLIPGADALEDIPGASLDAIAIAAPPGAIERRYVLALALRALKAGGVLTAVAPKDKGGMRLRKELEGFGCVVSEQSLRHQRLCTCDCPEAPAGLEQAIAEGAPQPAPGLGLVSQPGVFSWDRPDPGSLILARHLGGLAGEGADLGCGVGVLALGVLALPKVTALTLVDIDRRALDAARRNVPDPPRPLPAGRPAPTGPSLTGLDFVVMNPPFHDGGEEDRGLGQAFIRRAAAMLRRGGVLRLVANIGLPYEATLAEAFDQARRLEQGGGYKVLEGRRT